MTLMAFAGVAYLVLKAAAYFLRASLNLPGLSHLVKAITRAS